MPSKISTPDRPAQIPPTRARPVNVWLLDPVDPAVTPLTVICAWCLVTLRRGDPSHAPTHGICSTCTAEFLLASDDGLTVRREA